MELTIVDKGIPLALVDSWRSEPIRSMEKFKESYKEYLTLKETWYATFNSINLISEKMKVL